VDFAIFRVDQFVSGLPVMRLIQRYPDIAGQRISTKI
jgi:hypothetical protein